MAAARAETGAAGAEEEEGEVGDTESPAMPAVVEEAEGKVSAASSSLPAAAEGWLAGLRALRPLGAPVVAADAAEEEEEGEYAG